MIIGVDGRSGGGKSTLAAKLHSAVSASLVIHTDDVAWHHSMFDWSEQLATGVLEPIRAGHPVRYRPPGWETRGRPGALEIPSGLEVVIVEGVGAGRRELAHLLDALVWVQSDFAEAERRGIDRDIASWLNGDHEGATAFWHTWMAEEVPFLAHQRPWERASVIVAGTRRIGDGARGVVVAPPFAGENGS